MKFPQTVFAVIRCLDVNQLERSDPLTGDGSPFAERVVPIYGPPYEDSYADELVRAVLCARGNACAIHLASLQPGFR